MRYLNPGIAEASAFWGGSAFTDVSGIRKPERVVQTNPSDRVPHQAFPRLACRSVSVRKVVGIKVPPQSKVSRWYAERHPRFLKLSVHNLEPVFASF
jgi:hypothetical protein